MKKTTREHLRLLFYLLCLLWNINDGTCKNENLNFYFSTKNLNSSVEQESISLAYGEEVEGNTLMSDTACIAQSQDTFFVNTAEDVIKYNWTVPGGAKIVETLGDTMIVVDWRIAAPGQANICLSVETDCGTTDPSCFPVQISICHSAPIAVDDEVTTAYLNSITIEVQNNDSDPDNGILTTSLDSSHPPTNGTISLIGNNIQYTPSINFTGRDSFNYIICDDGIPSLCDTALVVVIVTNEAPEANPDTTVTTHGNDVTISVQNNDTDPEGGSLSTALDSGNLPTHGTATINGMDIVYISNLGFTGRDSFNYVICDNGDPVQCDTSSVLIIVENQEPIATNDTVSTALNTPITISVQANDTDFENGDLSTTIDPNNPPNNGTISINGDALVYTPNENFSGEDSLNYILCDDGVPQQCDTAKVFIMVNNGVPVVVPDAGTTWAEVPVVIDVQANDMDPEKGTLTTSLDPNSPPANGSVQVLDNDSILYIPNVGFTGMDQFGYIVCDDAIPAACDTAFVTITVLNEPPIARGDINYTLENMPVSGGILNNDFDPNGDQLILNSVLVQNVIHGLISLSLDGTYTYTPNSGFTGMDVFLYEICDDNAISLCDTGEVIIHVIGNDFMNNRPPIATPDNYVTEENTLLSANILSNDFDPDGDDILLNTSPLTAPSHGKAIVFPNGDFNYTPKTGFLGADIFTYNICDTGSPFLCDTAIVVINVIKDFRNRIFASDDVTVGNANTHLEGNVLSNDFDPEGDNILVKRTPVIAPANGTVSIDLDGAFVYEPLPNYTGLDRFSYEICDDGSPSVCDTAIVYLTILEINNAPYAIDDVNITPLNQSTSGNVLSNDIDLEDDELIINTHPIDDVDNGTLVLNSDGTYTYTPNPGFVGADIFTYEICDNRSPALCDTARVTIEVIYDDLTKNDPPVGVNDIYISLINVPVNSNVLSNDFDLEGDNISIFTTPIAPPDNGQVLINQNGDFTYTPNFNFNGDDYFTYQICDDGSPVLCDTVRVSLTIILRDNGFNYTFANDDVVVLKEDQPVMGNLLVNDFDPEGDIQTANPNPLKKPKHGTVNINLNGSFSYTPYANYNGADQFIYRVCDNGTTPACDTATVFLAILPIDDVPLAKNDINTTLINYAVSGQVLTNDEEPDGDDLVVRTSPFQNPQNGTVTLNTNGTYTYTPNLDFSGEDNFQYIVCDDKTAVLCDTAMVFITVIDYTNQGNNKPEGVEDNLLTLVNAPLNGDLLSNDSDPDNDPLLINTTPINKPNNGTLTINAEGTFAYTPNAGFIGEDEFYYEVCDIHNDSKCDTVLVTIEVLPNPGNTVFANDDAAFGKEDSQIQGNLLFNDFDPQGDQINVQTLPVRLPRHGTVNINLNGAFRYIPAQDYHGSDRFEYKICDTGQPIACDIATVFINVVPVNDTLCKTPLETPTLLSSNDEVCITDSIHLYTQENYPPVVLEKPDSNYRFIWYNGLGDSITQTSVSELKIAANAGLAISPFSLKVKLGNCSSAFSLPKQVKVINLPAITANVVGGNSSVCKGESVQLTASNVPNASYMWRELGSETIISTDRNPIISRLDTATTFEVMVMPEGCDTMAIAQLRVNVYEAPKVSPTINSTGKICEGNSLQLVSNATGKQPFAYKWTGPNGFSSTIANPSITNVTTANNGTYTVEVKDINACSTIGSLEVSEIAQTPKKPTIVNNSTICIDDTIRLNTPTIYTGTLVNYTWINGAGENIGLGRSLRIAADNPVAINPFILQVEVDGCLAEDSDLIEVDKQGRPTALATASANFTCKGEAVQLYAQESAQVTYEWRILGKEELISTLANPVFNNLQQTTDYELMVRNEDCSNQFARDTVRIVVNEIPNFEPTAAYTLNPDCSPSDLMLKVEISGDTTSLSFNWTGPNGFTSRLKNPVIANVTEDFNGQYLLEITDRNFCSKKESLFINAIKNAQAAPLISSESIACENDNLLLEVPAYEGNVVQYNWYENGILLDVNNSNKIFIDNAQKDTKYTLKVIVDACQLESDTFTPIILGQPLVTIDSTYENALCAGGGR